MLSGLLKSTARGGKMMTVGELIEVLQQYDADQTVYISQETGNYWRDVVAHEASDIGMQLAKYSEYNRALKLVDYDERDDDEDKVQQIVVIG